MLFHHKHDEKSSVCCDTEVLKTGGSGIIFILNNFTYTLIPNETFTQSWLLSSLEKIAVDPGELGESVDFVLFWCLQLLILSVNGQIPKNLWVLFFWVHFQGFSPFLFYKPAFLHLNICRNTCDLPLSWEVCLVVWHMPFYIAGFSHVTSV